MCRGSGDPRCTTLAMLARLVLEGPAVSEAIAVSEATGVFEARRWHDKRAATSGWSMAPDPSYCCVQVAWHSPIYNVLGTTGLLRPVALNCKRKGRHPIAPLLHYHHSTAHCSTAVAPASPLLLPPSLHCSLPPLPLLHCCRSTASMLHCHRSTLQCFAAVSACLAPTYSTKKW